MGNSVGKGLAGVNSLEGAVTGPSTPHGRGFQGDPTPSRVAYPARARSLHKATCLATGGAPGPGPSLRTRARVDAPPAPCSPRGGPPGGRPRDSWSHRVSLQAPRALGGAFPAIPPTLPAWVVR